MKKIKILIPTFIIILVLSLICLYPRNAEANNKINVEKGNSYKDTDDITTVEYNLFVELDGTIGFNFEEVKVILNNLRIVKVEGLNGFKVIKNDSNNLKYAFASNKTYTTFGSNNKLYFGRITAKKIDNALNCSLDIEPDPYKILKTNNFKISKEAVDDEGSVYDIYAGDEFDFKITVTPDLELESDEVTVTDTIPDEFEILKVNDNGTQNGQTVTWKLNTFSPGDPPKTVSVHVRAKENAKGRVVNKATLTVGDKSFTDDAPVNIIYSEITITKKASKDQVSNGETFYYDLVVKNVGTGKSQNVVVEDTLNSNLVYISSNPESTGIGNKLIFNLGTLNANQSKTIRINVKVKETNTLSTIPNTAVAKEGDKDPVQDDEDVKILKPNLTIEKTSSMQEVQRGNTFNYQIKVTNNGAGDAVNVLVKDTIDSNFEITKVSDGEFNNNNFTVTYPVLKSGESKTITITVRVKNNALLGTIPNTATAEADNNSKVSDDEPVTVVDSDITIKKVANKSLVKPGDEIIYTLTVTNNGTAEAKSLLVKDVIDNNLEIIETDGATRNGQTLTWTIASLAKGASKTYNIKVRVKDINMNMLIPNIASVKEPDKEEIEDEADVEVKIPEFTITKYALKTKPSTSITDYQNYELNVIKPGERFVYEIKVTNTSDVSGENLVVTDRLNDLLTIIDAEEGTINGQNITWTIPKLEAKASKTFYVTVELSKNAKSNTVIPNTAILKYKNETKEASDEVKVVDADVYLYKEASVKKVKSKDSFYYTLTIANTGKETAHNLTLTDVIPAKLNYERIEADHNVSSSFSNNTLKIFIASLAPNETIKIKVFVNVKENVVKDEVIKNVAVLTYDDKTLEDSEDVVVIDTDISLKKTSSVQYAINDKEYYYTITVTNNGEVDAKNLTVIDTYDEKLTILDPDNGVIEANTITWSVPNLKAKSSISFKVKVVVKDALNEEIINNEVVVKEPGKPDKNSKVDIPVKELKLTLVKSASKEEVTKNQEFEYTLKVTNESDYDIQDVVITDNIDPNLSIIKTDGKIVNNTITWTLNLKARETKTLTITVKVKNDCSVEQIPNIAEITYEGNKENSNEVVVAIVEVVNPQTGSIISYLTLGGGILSSLIIFKYIQKRRKFYHI